MLGYSEELKMLRQLIDISLLKDNWNDNELQDRGSKMYKLISIQHNGNKDERYKDRTDGRYSLRIGRICELEQCDMGLPLIIHWIKDQNGNDYIGTLSCSKVMGLSQEMDIFTVETLNTIYVFKSV